MKESATHSERDGGPAEAAATRAQMCDPRGKSGSRGRAGFALTAHTLAERCGEIVK